MSDERAQKAISRIEQAIARIEAASDRPAPPPSAHDNGELVKLRQVHQRLRDQVEDAIGEIDRLLEEAD